MAASCSSPKGSTAVRAKFFYIVVAVDNVGATHRGPLYTSLEISIRGHFPAAAGAHSRGGVAATSRLQPPHGQRCPRRSQARCPRRSQAR